jgi:hypothetical protein
MVQLEAGWCKRWTVHVNDGGLREDCERTARGLREDCERTAMGVLRRCESVGASHIRELTGSQIHRAVESQTTSKENKGEW